MAFVCFYIIVSVPVCVAFVCPGLNVCVINLGWQGGPVASIPIAS